jgi:hypothetical protein
MSVWESIEDLAAFVYGNAEHRRALSRRREWFTKMTSAYAALWRVPRGHVPTPGDDMNADARDAGTGTARIREDWICPA